MANRSEKSTYRWTSSSRTDAGMVRQINEDAMLDRPEAGLWAVADGMGGHAAGDVASGMIVQALAALEPREGLGDLVDAVEGALMDVNARLRQIAAQQEAKTVGSTVASLLIRGRHCVCMWAGDSRVYRYRDRRLEQMTQDHALVEDMVEKGMLSRAEAANHPQANLVTRAVGASSKLYVDLEIDELQDGDVFVLCSDGLDKEVGEEEIAREIADANGMPLADSLVELALSRGARDNVTVVAVRIEEHSDEDSTTPPRREIRPETEETVPGYTRARR